MTELPKFVTKRSLKVEINCRSLVRIDEISDIDYLYIGDCKNLEYIGTINNIRRLWITDSCKLISAPCADILNIDEPVDCMALLAPFRYVKDGKIERYDGFYLNTPLIDYPVYTKGIQRFKEVIRMRRFLRHCNSPAFWHPVDGIGGRLHIKSMTRWFNSIKK